MKTVKSFLAMCTIEGCDAKSVAKGLCSKHYMRLKRQGNADEVGKAGRLKNPGIETYRMLFREWSPRTLARYIRAVKMTDTETLGAIRQRRIRSNGTLNVAGILADVGFLHSKEFAQICEIMDSKGVAFDRAVMELART
jgi:hypothetical protein